MRILVLNFEFPPLGGGASPVTYEICKELANLGHKVDVVTMGFQDLPAHEVIDGFNIHRVKCLRKKKETCETIEMLSYLVSGVFFLNKLLKRKTYDICHCHFLIPTGLLALWAKKRFHLEYVVTSHGSDIPGYNSDRFIFEHSFTRPLLRLVANNARVVCSPSQYLKNIIRRKIGLKGIRYIPNGIDLDNFKLDLSRPKENIILSTGRLLKRKGFHTLIQAVHDINLPFEVHIAGDGPYRKNLEEMTKGSKTKIIFHGWIDKRSGQLLELYEKASIFALVSERENASISLLEGMAAKSVIVSTNITGCAETVGDAGFLIDYDDVDKLRGILTTLSESPKTIQEYSQKAYNRLINNFLWDNIIVEYEKLFFN